MGKQSELELAYEYDDSERDDDCWQCRGEKYLVAGEDIEIQDAVNNYDWSMGCHAGEVGKCPCCGGTGLAKDCTYW
jgi:hypothetical protein